ncbi:replication-relaxation family protein [Micromonospora tarapacensis]|uniref:replication-relaxation family protein n=1 Tax=Micromonospora tarapacensis TaxID=2835305 RepID=UPI0038B3B388
MPRDRWLIELLGEHQVFTTEQVAALCFDHLHTARNRLVLLNQRGILARFRDGVRPGSQQWRWTLDLIGLAYLAARADQPAPKPATVRQRVNRLATSPKLGHLLGVNGFFVDLAAHARTTPGAELSVWWSERTCRTVTGELVRPDGHGVWTEHGTTVSFWLEWDQGTEQAHRVASKLDGYADLHRATGLNHLVLVWAPTPARETSLRSRLARHPAVASGTLTVATGAGGTTEHPAGPVWAPATGTGDRVRLARLATHRAG